MPEKKKILVLAYDFPPLNSIGAHRPASWMNYLPEFSYEVCVVTRHWNKENLQPEDFVKATHNSYSHETSDNGSLIVRAPFKPNFRDKILTTFGFKRFKLLRKIASFFYSFVEHLFFSFDNKATIYKAAKAQIKSNAPDVIIATGEPFILFKYASSLSAEFGIPWIADYRDGWTSNQGEKNMNAFEKLQNKFFIRREKKYLANVSAITTAAPDYAAVLKSDNPQKKIEVVFNGYEDKIIENSALTDVTPASEKFVVLHAGTLHPHQNLELFLEGVKRFIETLPKDEKKFELHFYGIGSTDIQKKRLLSYDENLTAYIVTYPRIPLNEILVKMRSANILLLPSRKNAGWLNAKIFDYLAVNRPILLVENDKGILEKLLNECGGGVCANSALDVKNMLTEQYAKWKNGEAVIGTANENFKKYSRRKQAESLSKIISELLK